MIRFTTLLLALALACGVIARADVILPGTVRAQHTLRFVNVAEHPQHAFFVAAPDTPIVIDVPPSGEVDLSVPINSMLLPEGIHLYAVPRSTPVPADLNGKLAVLRGGAGVLRSKRLVDPVSLVAEGNDPEVFTEYRIAIGEALVVEQVGGTTTRLPARTYVIPGASAAAIVLVIALARRRRKRRAASGTP